MNWGIKVLQTSALPLGYGAIYRPKVFFSQDAVLLTADLHTYKHRRTRTAANGIFYSMRFIMHKPIIHESVGADYGARTRHLDLGKVALYQMS